MKRIGFVAAAVLYLMFAGAALAQECPVIVQEALQAVDSLCARAGRNQTCYGNLSVSAIARDTADNFQFDAPGDIARLGDLVSLQLQPMDIAARTWGIVLLRAQASIPDTLPGQNVTFLLFGNVEFEPVNPTNTFPLTANSGMNVRAGPGTNHPIVTTLAAGSIAQAKGRNAAGDWLLVDLPGGGSGWVFAQLVTVDGTITDLDVADAGAGITQAFYFRSGVGDAPCAEAPDSGLLMHTPAGLGEVELLINEVRFSVGSTVYVQAAPGSHMIVTVIEGAVTVFVAGIPVTIQTGESIQIPLDANGLPAGPPSEPLPVDLTSLDVLPVHLVMRDTGYAGRWQSTDIDGSTQTLRVWLEDGVYQFEWYDDGASVCGQDSAGNPLYAVTLTGSATALATGGVSVAVSGNCEDGANTRVGPFVIPFNYDPAADTLYDSTLTWTRTD